MSNAVASCLRRRLGLVGPEEVAPRLLGGLVSSVLVFFLSAMMYCVVLARFFGKASRRGNVDPDVANSIMDPTIVFGLTLFFLVVLPFCAWYEGTDDPDRSDRMQQQGCAMLAVVFLGGSLLKAVRVFVPRRSPLSPAQFQLAVALIGHLLNQTDGVDSETLGRGVLSGNNQLTQHDFDVVMCELRERNLVTADPVRVESRFKADIRHAEG